MSRRLALAVVLLSHSNVVGVEEEPGWKRTDTARQCDRVRRTTPTSRSLVQNGKQLFTTTLAARHRAACSVRIFLLPLLFPGCRPSPRPRESRPPAAHRSRRLHPDYRPPTTIPELAAVKCECPHWLGCTWKLAHIIRPERCLCEQSWWSDIRRCYTRIRAMSQLMSDGPGGSPRPASISFGLQCSRRPGSHAQRNRLFIFF
ncbi:hypothetical protein C2E23DRAFT_334787 [Lenzites betulinus]|nr:hypothetical protein C2E23DRAFT_334787 [Lenzites betulinus]